MTYCGLYDQHLTHGRFFLCLSLWRSLLTNCNQNTRSRKECIDFFAPPGVFLVPPFKLVDITRRGELSNVDTWGGHCFRSKCFLMVSVKADRAMYKHISMGSYVYLELLKSATSHKIYCLLRNFTLTMKTLFQTYYLVVFARHDICQNVYTSRLGTDHILPVKV